MRKLVTSTFVTLDGVMQAPGGPDEDPSGGFQYGGWSTSYWDDVMGEAMAQSFSVQPDLLLGRRTYQIFAAHWPYVTDDPTADVLNQARKYVASATLDRVDWHNSVLLNQDVSRQVAKLKQQDGPEIQVSGSAVLIQTLLRHNLIDEFRIWTFPVVVGKGKRLFGDGTMPAGLTLTESRTSSTGVVMSTYQPAGEIPLGSFALEEPTAAEVERRERLAGQ